MHGNMKKLERDILNWIAARCGDQSLAEQCRQATAPFREYTGVGVFVTLEVPESVEVCGLARAPEVPYPYVNSPDLEYGAGCVLFLEDGRLDTLEIFAYGDSFPEDIDDYVLEDRDA